MNQFAWNFTVKWNTTVNLLEYDYIESFTKDWDKNIFVFWETNSKTSEEKIKFFEEKFWELLNYDISISTEDKIEIFSWDYEEWVYEVVSFEWEQVDFNEIKDRFNEVDEVVSIREAEISNKFWNRVIKVDFVY
jgi:hypothetical protein